MTIVKTVRRVQIGQAGGGGGDSPALGHAGYNFGTDTATDDVIIIDLRMPTNTYEDKIWLSGYPDGILDRASTATYQNNGGYWGQGCLRMVPGAAHGNEANDPRHEMMCGIGQLYGLNSVAPGSSCTKLTIGVLVRYGASYWSLLGGGKPIIVIRQDAVRRDNGQPRNTRPMVISDSLEPGIRSIGPHDGTIGNFNTDPDGTDYFNESGVAPDQRDLQGVAQWIQFEVDLDQPVDGGSIPIGQGRLRIWDEAEELNGAPILRKGLYEDVGGTLPTIDTILGWVVTVASIDSGYYYDLEYIEIWVGQSTGMTPPHGFPGSNR